MNIGLHQGSSPSLLLHVQHPLRLVLVAPDMVRPMAGADGPHPLDPGGHLAHTVCVSDRKGDRLR